MSAFIRTMQLLGPEAMRRLDDARVSVFGLGGVGSWAAEALARAGVGHLRLVDFDAVKESNINRQLYALHSTLGRYKTELACGRIRDINPRCDIDIRTEFVEGKTLPSLLEPRPDAIIDAIDSLSPKVRLIHAAASSGIAIVSSMGAAGRTDPSKIHIADIAQTQHCPLARFVRKKLHRLGIFTGVRCVYSTETARHTAAHASDDEGPELVKGRKRQPLGSISYMPAIFGFMAAGETVRLLLNQ